MHDGLHPPINKAYHIQRAPLNNSEDMDLSCLGDMLHVVFAESIN